MRQRTPGTQSTAKRRSPTRSGQMRVREFMALLPDLVRPHLAPDLRAFKLRGPRHSLVGFYYEDERVHYEVWVQARAARLEIGLHYEADPECNRQGLEALSAHAAAITAALGPTVEGEEWTKHWTRIHENVQLAPLSQAYAAAVAERIAAFINVLEPLRQVGLR